MINFDLFIQSGYSFNGSLIDIIPLVQNAKILGYKTLGLADHNNLYGAIKFYKECTMVGIKPLIGIHAYITLPLLNETPILLYAKTNQGYLNLIQISSYLATEKDVLTLDTLSAFQKDIICVFLTSRGGIFQALVQDDISLVSSAFQSVKKKVQSVYLGLDLNDFTVEMKIAPVLESIGETIIVNQVAYFSKDDKLASRVLRNILKEQKQIEEGLFFSEDSSYELKSLEVLDRQYSQYTIQIERTLDLIESTNVSMSFSNRFIPKYPLDKKHAVPDYLKALALKGLEKRLANKKTLKVSKETYYKRLNDELSIIHNMEYDDYFLIVWDFVLFAKKRKILVGPGRGSAAGSLVAYVLGIVDVDPMDFDLYFERFLNPERITMPDIDMDFPDDRRDDVIQYVVSKYGRDHVSSIITFGTFQGKSALRDTAKMLNIPDSIVSEVTMYVAETDNSIDSFKEQQPKQYENLMQNQDIKHLFDIASKLVGLPRHISTHAAGIIITDKPITDYSPVGQGLAGMLQTQYEASDLEAIGLLKIDFLGIRNLTTIAKIIDVIKENTGEDVDLYKIPFDDPKTYHLFQNVNTLGVFQLESSGMMNLLRQMQIDKFEDISTCIALFRPGPMESIPEYLLRRSNPDKITYLHEDLKPILESTEGIIIYQEQIMKIANVFAGYSLGEADVLRRAVSKKKESTLLEERTKFISKCLENNRDETISNLIYDYIVKFANYGFNKSHSVVYSLVAYWMAYLKANYPAFFMAVLLDASIGSQTATSDYVKECRKLNIKILPPSINKSSKYYQKENGNLRYPYLGIKNIGTVVADKLVEIKGEKPFSSFIDFISRAKDINSRVVESLILVGMFDEFPLTKKTMIENIKQLTIFLSIPQMSSKEDFIFIEYEEYDFETLQLQEKELIGFNLRYHPMSKYQDKIDSMNIDTVSDILKESYGEKKFIGMIRKIKVITTKKKDEMAFLIVEDQFSDIECVLFPTDYMLYSKWLDKEQLFIFTGTSEFRNHQSQFVIKTIEKWEGEI
ncbi:MAG: DNA polymerase III subunit alpha [Candidatus Izemoplasmatales bacterium]|nr:DNA polymerase III subunit alpha [Candidatus Izemoplasmatales bacterium]